MPATKKIGVGNALLCDYVTVGQGNKHVLVNCYSGSIIVSSIPVRLQLYLYVEVLAGQPDLLSFALELFIDKNKLAEIKVTIDETTPGEPTVVFIPFNMVADHECDFHVHLISPGFSRKKIISKKIMLRPGPDET